MLSPHTFHTLTTTEPFGTSGRHARAIAREHRRAARRRAAEDAGIRRPSFGRLRLRPA